MTKGGLFSAGIAAVAGVIVFAFAGVVMLAILAIHSVFTAAVALIPVLYLESKRSLRDYSDPFAMIIPLVLGFVVAAAVGFGLDLIFGTWYSVPRMIEALDLTRNEYARKIPLIEGVLDYYRLALGGTPSAWIRFAGYQLAMVLVVSQVAYRVIPAIEGEDAPAARRIRNILAMSAVAVATAAVTVFPATVKAMIAFRNAIR